MSVVSIFLIALGLAMDATVVSLTLGIRACKENKVTTGIKAGLYFGGFQGLMPLIGWMLGKNFTEYITSIDHWIAFALLSIIGGKMLIDTFKEEEEEACIMDYSTKLYLTLAIATSIDALAVGISLAFLNVNILTAVTFIASITFVLSFIGVITGEKVGSLVKNKATVLGGLLLIFIGVKILIEHLGVSEVLLSFFK